jgi:hypothetical protein
MATKDVRFGASRLQIKKFNISEMVDHCTMPIVRMLVESYRDGLSIADADGDWPAGLAAIFGRIEAVEYLLEQYPLAVDYVFGFKYD